MNKKVNFYKYEIIIKNDLKLDFLLGLEDSNTEPTVIKKEVIQVDEFKKLKFSDRFWGLYFQSGDLFNYSKNVIDTKNNLKKKKNPRKNTDIEFDKQFFFLIDRKNNFIYLSDNKQKTYITNWIKDRTSNTAILKVILDEKKFRDGLQKISEIDFVFKNERTFFKNSPLDESLLNDLYNFDADSVNVNFKYKHKNITEKVKSKIDSIFNEKNNFKSIRIVGRDDKDIDLIFNSKGIVSRIILDEPLDNQTKSLDPKSVFSNLIMKIKIYEKK